MLFALMVLAAAQSTPAEASWPDPLGPAAAGKMECYAPTDHKTCSSMSSYAAGDNGQFADIGTVMLSSDPVVILKATTQVRIKDGEVCGVPQAADITGGSLTVNGNAVPPDKAAPLLQHIADQLTPLIGHEICTIYIPQGDGFMTQGLLDGKRHPEQDQKMIWVSPADGYTVAP